MKWLKTIKDLIITIGVFNLGRSSKKGCNVGLIDAVNELNGMRESETSSECRDDECYKHIQG